MKKLVIKTVAFTIAIIVVVLSVSYILFAILSPSTVSNVYFKLGNKNMSLKYSVNAFEKSEDISDLANIVERAIVFENAELVDEYGTLLINYDGYRDYSLTKGNGYDYYVVGSIAESKYKQGNAIAAAQLALNNTDDYTTVNPIRVVLSLAISAGDTETVNFIKENLANRQASDLLSSDLNAIENYLNSQGV